MIVVYIGQGEILNGDVLVGRPSQEALHDWPIGLALGLGRNIAVLAHGSGNVSVSHEFLLHVYGTFSVLPLLLMGGPRSLVRC